jgi:hypothetical protein
MTKSLLFLVLMLCPFFMAAQSIKRQVISSYGTLHSSGSVSFSQTGGQSYGTSTMVGTQGLPIFALGGFQQPQRLKAEEIYVPNFSDINISVFPNPASLFVHLKCDKKIDIALISVFDIKGRKVYDETVSDFEIYTLKCDEWENGIYVINVSDKGYIFKSIKLIINK